MRHYRSPLNPAGTAIAAVLALAPFGAVAQIADPAAQPAPATAPPVVSQPAPVAAPPPAAPTTGTATSDSTAPQPVFAPSSPVVQQVPTETTPPSSPLPAEESTAPASKPATQTEPKTVTQAKPVVTESAPARMAARPATAPAPAISDGASGDALAPPGADGSDSDATTSSLTAPPVAMMPSPSSTEGQPQSGPSEPETPEWALGLGALALLGAGGVSVAMLRRRPSDEVVRKRRRRFSRYDPPLHHRSRDEDITDEAVAASSPQPPQHSIVAEALTRAHMAEATEQSSMSTIAAKDGLDREMGNLAIPKEPVYPVQPGNSAIAPSGDDGDLAARREAMIAQAPTPENPFLTRRKRLCRANFILRQQGSASVEPEKAMAPVQAEATEQAIRQVPRPDQVSYRFGGGIPSSPTFKPKYN